MRKLDSILLFLISFPPRDVLALPVQPSLQKVMVVGNAFHLVVLMKLKERNNNSFLLLIFRPACSHMYNIQFLNGSKYDTILRIAGGSGLFYRACSI